MPLLLDLAVLLTLLIGDEEYGRSHQAINTLMQAIGNTPVHDTKLAALLATDPTAASYVLRIKPIARFKLDDLATMHEYALEVLRNA